MKRVLALVVLEIEDVDQALVVSGDLEGGCEAA
jgi:hypothetical protein